MVEKSPEADLLISEPGGIMGVDSVKKATNGGETLSLVPLHSYSDTGQQQQQQQRKVVGETTAETKSLLSASVENYNTPADSSSVQIRSEFRAFQYHVLAVDDSRMDRRVIEKLLKTSSYKGQTPLPESPNSRSLKTLEIDHTHETYNV